MPLRRRLAFATPFVIVVACKSPATVPHEPPAPEDDPEPAAPDLPPADARVAVQVPDAAPPVPVDASIPVDSDPLELARKLELCRNPRNRCNPPPPPEPPSIAARVVHSQVSGPFNVVVINRGSTAGVTQRWHACIVPGLGATTCLPGGELMIIHVDERSTHARAKLSQDQIHANPYVRLEPP